MARKGKQKQFGKPKAQKAVGNRAQLAALQKIQDAIDKSDLTTAYQLADAFTQKHATSPHGWEMLANVQAQQQCLNNACASMQKAIELAKGDNPLSELKLAQYELFSGDARQCIRRLKVLSEKIPTDKRVWVWLSRAYHVVGLNKEALEANNKAYELDNQYPDTLVWRARVLDQLKRHSEAFQISTLLKKIKPDMVGVSNHLASLSLREGDYQAADQYFKDELTIGNNASAAYNSFIAKHYNPFYSAEELAEIAKKFQVDYIQEEGVERASTEKRKNKRVRLGLMSGSFRTHPVGQMILPALRAVDKNEVELVFYTTNQIIDKLTLEIQKVADSWVSVVELSDEQLSQKIRQDKIDILIDMNGGGEGSRFIALAKEPAPLIVKWVGILINTTGLTCFDYLLSDSIETPRNVDHLYTEKLIRLPDDYVCYHLPDYAPEVTSLPALKNGFVTFGCLNNPAKLSRDLIKEWSALMHEVPSSKLLLRGIQFEGEAFCQRTTARFAEFNIGAERLLLEGPAQHKEFLETYQRIDIALDTWPYSGGLTTCEALAMGVPVVTCVGPTFAGRHSATHLANAGLPELVTDNWDDFRKRAKELVADLPSLAVIRAALRTILKESPVCDGARFAKHFTQAMRAIWQRHCEGKAPEALTFNKEGDAWFADEVEPVALVEVESAPEPQEAPFEWDLDSPVMVMDNGARFARHPRFAEWMQTGNFSVITFDPGSLLTNEADALRQLGDWHHYPHATLGDGSDGVLYATLNPELTGTLKPLESELTGELDDPLRILSTLPISTVPLKAIEGLPSIDLLVIDDLNDGCSLLENAGNYLDDILVVEVKINIKKSHQGQLGLVDVEAWASKNNFNLFGFCSSQYGSVVDAKNKLGAVGGLESLVGVYVPSDKRMHEAKKCAQKKLTYILSEVYGFHQPSGLELHKSKEDVGKVDASVVSDVCFSSVKTLDQAKVVVDFVGGFKDLNDDQLFSIIKKCEESLSRNQSDNTAFFVLTHALLNLSFKDNASAGLEEALMQVGWNSKGALYSYWFKDVEQISPVSLPACSIIVIANKFKKEILSNVEELRRQGGEGVEIIFVNNGAADEDFIQIRRFINTLVTVNGNSGAYVARNMGFLFSQAPIVLFVDDDGFPEGEFINPHLDLHARKSPVCVRGIYKSRSGNDPSHYNLGEKERISPPTLEGNVSFCREAFAKVGGWGDYILFGHGGFDISLRIFNHGYSTNSQLYTPGSVLQHEYLRGEAHAKDKFEKQAASGLLLDALHGGLTHHIKKNFSNTVSSTSESSVDEEEEKKAFVPSVTFPENVKEFVLGIYEKAECILEYGSGGSTVQAASLPNKKIFVVENDRAWAENMEKVFSEGAYPSVPTLCHVDLGKTKKWAKPVDDRLWKQFPNYSLSVWEQNGFCDPDVVLIDGRMRTSCLLSVILKAKKKTLVLFDDYSERKYYHVVERIIRPIDMVGRMAVFEIDPSRDYISSNDWLWVIQEFYKVTLAGKDGR